MRCAQCGFENPDGMRFCGGCGSPLSRRCDACGTGNPVHFRFCGACGTALATDDARTPAPAERRQLTVMFCDLVGSTSLSAQLDPEELREVVQAYQTAAAAVIGRYDGYVAQHLGDGILAYFGFPVALENEAGRAVHAGRDLVREIRGLSDRLAHTRGIRLATRVGIHTGVVVVGEIGSGASREHLALGETPNVAARVQAIAVPDSVVLTGETHRLVEHEFDCEDLGTFTLNGIPQPVHLFRPLHERGSVLGAGLVGARAEPLIGRDREMSALRDEWAEVLRGRGRIVTIGGEAGLGKTSLVRAFVRDVLEPDHTLLEGRCLPYFRNTAYQPVLDLVRRWLGCGPADDSPQQTRLLTALLERLDLHDPAQVLVSLLGGSDADDRPIPAAPRPEGARAALLELLLRPSADHPTVLYLEDIHWADPSTLELLGELAERIRDRPVLAVVTHRPEFEAPWPAPPHQTALELSRLRAPHVSELIARLCGRKPLPERVEEQIVARTDGVPLFVEELTKMVLESGLLRDEGDRYELVGETLPPLAIPLTLHDSLEARLERLAAVKELAQLGAVLGRHFRYDVLRAVAGVEEETLRAALERLVQAELLVEESPPPTPVYAFKHALIHEAAYQGLLKGVRQMYHLRTARVLEDQFPEYVAANPERVAQHYTAAGMPEQALEHWLRAGRTAVERSATREALTHLREGLALVPEIPGGPGRDSGELDLLLALGPALIATEGHASPQVRNSYLRAQELARNLGDPPRRFQALGGLFSSYFVRSEGAEAHEAARELMEVATESGEPGYAMAAHVALGVSLLGRGAIEEALVHLDEGVAAYRPERDFPLAHGVGQDFGVVGTCYGAYAELALGHPDRALRRMQRAVELARSLRHPHSEAFALAFLANVAYLRREPRRVRDCLAELNEVARREGYPHWLAGGPALEAWARAETGDADGAVERLRSPDAATTLQDGGAEVLFWRHVAAEALLLAGRPDEALPLLSHLRAALANRGAHLWWISETFRVHGLTLARLGRLMEADAALEQAVEGARTTGARFFLLRAVRDLAELREGAPGREALEELGGLSAAFAEGADLPDLLAVRRALGVRATPPRRRRS